MAYKNFYLAIFIRIILIIAISIGGTIVYFKYNSLTLLLLVSTLLVISVLITIKYFNKINNWIAYFLLGIENEDTTLKIPSNTGNKAIDEVFVGMKRLNNIFKQTKIKINTQEQYFRATINQSATGLFSINSKCRISNINPAAVKLTGLQEYYHVNALSEINHTLPKFIINFNNKQNNHSAIFENKYGQKLLFKLSEIITNSEHIKLVAVSDITKELDNREVDAWIKLARTLSHEIMNNITPITTLSKIISDYYTKNNQVIDTENISKETIKNTVKGLQVIEDRSIALMNFVKNYRKFTKLPQPKINNVNISLLVENCIVASGAFANFDKIKINKNIPAEIMFFTDDKLLSQVIINIIKNASEELINTKNPTIWINVTKNTNSIKIEISNNGSEIPDEIKEQIFVPFYTTKEDGSGIGLSLSKQILLQMNSDIVLKSTNNKITTFEITLN